MPRSALVVLWTIEMAIEGVIATDPDDPICAVVATVSEDVALKERLFAPVSVAPLPSSAVTESLTMAKATEAPRPNFVPVVSTEGVAEVVTVAASAAVIVTSPPPALTAALGEIRPRSCR